MTGKRTEKKRKRWRREVEGVRWVVVREDKRRGERRRTEARLEEERREERKREEGGREERRK